MRRANTEPLILGHFQVDLILGMDSPAGSLALLWDHTSTLRCSRITIITALHLSLNVIGRISVSAFGLTFDLNEVGGDEPPVLLTNWSSPGTDQRRDFCSKFEISDWVDALLDGIDRALSM